MLRSIWLLVTAVWFLAMSGCSATVYQPRLQSDSVPVYIADYGRHSSLVLPVQTGGYVEWAFSDWNWHALGNTTSNSALFSLIGSPQSTLGRRVIPPQPDPRHLEIELHCKRLLSVYVPEARVNALMDELDRRYLIHGATQIYSSYSNLDHVKDDEHYWLLNNCNHLTVRWLKQLGCRVDGMGIQSGFKVVDNESLFGRLR